MSIIQSEIIEFDQKLSILTPFQTKFDQFLIKSNFFDIKSNFIQYK